MRCPACEAELEPCTTCKGTGWRATNTLVIGSHKIAADRACEDCGDAAGWQPCWGCSASETVILASTGQG